MCKNASRTILLLFGKEHLNFVNSHCPNFCINLANDYWEDALHGPYKSQCFSKLIFCNTCGYDGANQGRPIRTKCVHHGTQVEHPRLCGQALDDVFSKRHEHQ